MLKSIGETELLEHLNSRYGTKPLVQYYLRKAKDAAGRAQVALTSQNPYALGAEAQIMITNIMMVYSILGDDGRGISVDSTSDTKTSE